MSDATNISWLSLGLSGLLLAIPIVVVVVFRIGKLLDIVLSVARMAVQLFLVGIFLGYVFELNSTLLNIAWFLMMVGVAAGTVIKRSDLKLRTLLLPAASSLLVSGGLILLFFTVVILRLGNPIEARYFIALGGMLLGNALRGNVVGVTSFYSGIKREENRYLFRLAAGAGHLEALMPEISTSLRKAISPTIATAATMGIVALPGMMTGQIIGGSSPLLAVKYQIAIMLAIFATVTLATTLCILMTIPASFDSYGMLKREVFADS